MSAQRVKSCLLLFVVFSNAVSQRDSETLFEFIPKNLFESSPRNSLSDEDAQLTDFLMAVQDHTDEEHFVFRNFKLTALKGDTFDNITNGGLKTLVLDNIQMDLLLEPPYVDFTKTYTSMIKLEELTTLVIIGSQLVYGWDFDELYDKASRKGLENLRNIHMKDNKLYYVSHKLLTMATNPRYISIEDCQVYWTEPIENTLELEWLSLSKNNLEEIPGGFIGNVAPELWYLDLSHNNLKTLPKDLTDNAQYLREINLSHNELTTVYLEVVDRVWDNLDALWIDNNELEMDHDDLCYYLKKCENPDYYRKPMFWYTARNKVGIKNDPIYLIDQSVCDTKNR